MKIKDLVKKTTRTNINNHFPRKEADVFLAGERAYEILVKHFPEATIRAYELDTNEYCVLSYSEVQRKELPFEKVGVIFASDLHNGIGKNNALPWNLKGELKHFSDVTRTHAVIMGSRTAESIALPLMRRGNYIVSSGPGSICYYRNQSYGPDDQRYEYPIVQTNTIEAALAHAATEGFEEVWFIGGVGIFSIGIDIADVVIRSEVAAVHDCDVFLEAKFIEKMNTNFEETETEIREGYTIRTLKRKHW